MGGKGKHRWKISFYHRSNSNPKPTHPPKEFLCPISESLMSDPVVVTSDQTFESLSVQVCRDLGFAPVLDDHSVPDFTIVIPNLAIKSMILNWCDNIGVYSSSLSSVASDLEQEQEEVVMCLMMLSKDSGFKGCFSSIADSSDNNSVVLETKSSSPKFKVSLKNGVNCVYNGNGIGVLEMKKAKQQEILSIENDHSENSDSGYFRNGPKKVESDISVHGFTRKEDFKKQKVEFGSRFEDDFDPELGKRLSRFRLIKKELGKDLVDEDRFDEYDRVSLKYDSRKKAKNESYNSEFLSSNGSKTGKCPIVGAHRTNHKRTNGCSDSIYESGENSINTDCVPSRKIIKSFNGKNPIEQKLSGNAEKKLGIKKGKIHECPFCFKVFRSGQALGGHKRSHFVGSGEDRTVVINQQVPEMSMPGLIDLNLPAPMEEDANGYYIPTW